MDSSAAHGLQRAKESSGSEKEKETLPYEIDYLGNGSFQVTQLNLLMKRSIEPTQNSDAQLSARGLHHRSRSQFEKDIKSATNIIMLSSLHGAAQNDVAEGQSSQPEFHLFAHYFQRALAYERVGNIDAAISDYNTVLSIYPDYAPAYFNRAGLYNAQGHTELALTGINHAISLDPSNLIFRKNKSLLLRQKGNYMDAINETMICRAVQMQPSLGKDLIAGNSICIPDSAQLLLSFKESKPVDEVTLAMEWKKQQTLLSAQKQQKRRLSIHGQYPLGISASAAGDVASDNAVVDFLTDVKFFRQYSSDRTIIKEFASKLDMRKVEKDGIIFKNEDIGYSFFIILWGEVALLNDQILNSNGRNKIINDPNYKSVQKFGRGMVFGEETVIEGTKKSVERTLNAVCTQDTTLLVMGALDYYKITKTYDKELRKEMKKILLSCKPFLNFEDAKINYLVSKMKLKHYDMASEVLTSGELVKDLCIVRIGVVKLIKTLPRPVMHATSPPPGLPYPSSPNKCSVSRGSSMPSSPSAPLVSTAAASRRASLAKLRKAEEEEGLTGVGVGSATLSGLGPPGLWVIEKSWRDHSEEDKRKMSRRKTSPGRPVTSTSTRTSLIGTPLSAEAMRQAKQAKDLRDVLRSSSSFNLNSSLGQVTLRAKRDSFDEGSPSSIRDEWCSTVGLLGAGQIFGEICVLNPKIVSTISGVAYTKVELFTIDGEELIAQGIRFDSNSMNLLNQSFNLYNPSAEKVSYYFKSKVSWEREKQKVVAGILKENPRIQARLLRQSQK